MIFHSIYLPTKDGKSVTFKLQCAKTNLAALKPAFETKVLMEHIPKPKLEDSADQPATAPESVSEGNAKPKRVLEARPQ